MNWDELRGHAGLRGGVLVYTGAHRAGPARAAGAVPASVPAQKGKSRGSGAKTRADKPRTPARAQGWQSKRPSPRTPRQTPAQPTPSPDVSLLREPLDVGPILDDLLDRVMVESALAAVARQRVPFTVSRARDAILFVAEWKFLARDEGDPEPEGVPDPEGDPDHERDGIWSQDEEPQSCPWDSWTPGVVPADYESFLSSEDGPSEDVPVAAEDGKAESLPVCPQEVPDPVPGLAVPVSPDQGPSEDVPVTAEAEGPPVCPGEVPDAAPVLAVPLPPDQVPAAAAAASPDQLLGADIVAPVSEPPLPEPPIAPQPPERGRRLSRDPGRGGIPAQPPERDRRPSRPPRPRPAPLDAPRPRAPLPAAASEPAALAPQASREATAKVGHQVPPPPPSRPSLVPIQPRRPSRGSGVPRLGARRVATRWVLPEVKVVDASCEPEWARSGAPRPRMVLSGVSQVLPGPGRARRAEPQLFDPWLASARLAPGVTVRWGHSERRGPVLPGHEGHGDDEEDNEAVRRSEKELKPILAYPECRLSEYDE